MTDLSNSTRIAVEAQHGLIAQVIKEAEFILIILVIQSHLLANVSQAIAKSLRLH
jgi:hypothetical protein